PIGTPMKHERSVNGAAFNGDESRILTYSSDGTARLWDISIDLKFPDSQLRLMVEVRTGYQMDDYGNIKAIPTTDWYKKKKTYEEFMKQDSKK
ncbi:hypothetical protein JXJ21_08970, partial [candidate division KSB1 bacterium]|nr:hypothetical protein [candidate division KSB1 bacterium]